MVWPFFKRFYREVVDDGVDDTAAQLAFYVLFALFPFLFFLATLTAYLPLEGAVDEMLARLAAFMPAAAFELVAGHLTNLIEQPKPKLLTITLLTTLWSASRGVDSFRKALNLAYDVKERRAFWKTQPLAICATVGGAAMVFIAVATIILGGDLGLMIAERLHGTRPFEWIWGWLRWPIAAVAVMFTAALNYYVLPDVKQQVRFIIPGAVIGTLLWLSATWAFTQYADSFGRFNVTYGSIGGVIVLLIWIYVSGLVFILGGELNSTLEQQSKDGKAKGAREAGAAPEPLIDRPSVASPATAKSAAAATRSRLRLWLQRRR